MYLLSEKVVEINSQQKNRFFRKISTFFNRGQASPLKNHVTKQLDSQGVSQFGSLILEGAWNLENFRAGVFPIRKTPTTKKHCPIWSIYEDVHEKQPEIYGKIMRIKYIIKKYECILICRIYSFPATMPRIFAVFFYGIKGCQCLKNLRSIHHQLWVRPRIVWLAMPEQIDMGPRCWLFVDVFPFPRWHFQVPSR